MEKLIWGLQHVVPFQIIHKWVKGHQNKLKSGKKIFGPFKKELQLNIEMDCLAGTGCNLPIPKCEVYTHTKIAVFDDEGILISNMETHLYNSINGKVLHTYISKKYD